MLSYEGNTNIINQWGRDECIGVESWVILGGMR